MKSKFDKIMANFLEDNKKNKKVAGIHHDLRNKENEMPSHNEEKKEIQDFKNKNAKSNMKGIF